MEKGRHRFSVTADAYGLTISGISRSLASRPPYRSRPPPIPNPYDGDARVTTMGARPPRSLLRTPRSVELARSKPSSGI